MLKSFIVTGASAVGKSTLLRNMEQLGYNILPSYTTRLPRPGEEDGDDYFFLSEETFLEHLENGKMLERDSSVCLLKASGVHYGTPSFWVTELANGGSVGNAMTLSGAKVAHFQSGATWVHLICDNNIRKKRLELRGHTNEEIDVRLHSGMWFIEIPECAKIIDTSRGTALDTVREVQRMVDI